MKAYLRAFVNFEQNNKAGFLSITKFAYNNAKNASTSHMTFELNCGYHSYLFFKKDTNLGSQLKTSDKLLTKLQNLITICQKNFYYTQEF